jgi:hypothetical protein
MMGELGITGLAHTGIAANAPHEKGLYIFARENQFPKWTCGAANLHLRSVHKIPLSL